MIIQHCRLDLNPSNVKPIVAVSQYDTARQIVFHLYEDDTEYTPQAGASAKVLIGTEQLEGTISGSTVTFEISENLTRNEISKFGEVVIYGDGKVSTCNFIFRVYFTPIKEAPEAILTNTLSLSKGSQTGLNTPQIEKPMLDIKEDIAIKELEVEETKAEAKAEEEIEEKEEEEENETE